MVLYEYIVEEIINERSYAVDYDLLEAHINYGDVKKYLGKRFHIPRVLQGRVIDELVRKGLVEKIDQKTIKVYIKR